MAVILKSREEIARLREAGRIVAETYERLERYIAPGVSTGELDRRAEEYVRSRGALPTYKDYTPRNHTAFPATMPTYTAGGNYDQANGPSSVAAWGNASFQTVYSWDVQPIHGESSGLVGTFYPMAVTNGCGAGQPGA